MWIRQGTQAAFQLLQENAVNTVSFAKGPAHGYWAYEWKDGVGFMKIWFHCQAIAEKVKEHELIQLPGTMSFMQTDWPHAVMIKLEDQLST